ncbi:DnaT-like ssDNA-binding protein, partial [Marinimicrobium sp. UBA4509]|uniref:DnaT-like ssDNA-binding protein n=1 Tax=Marinimicrobium sp. UBA4509 TaxID=1946811 RepID=UPI00257998D3
MAVTIDATAGGASANSYMTLAQADAYVEAMISSADVTAWSTGSDDTRNRALTAAAQRLDRERFIGARATDTQALQWPRTGVRKPDTYVNTYATGFPFRISEDYFTDTEIPDQIKRAQVELAVYLKNNVEGISLGGLEDFKNVKIG